MNQNEQMREALQAIEAVLEDAYHRHFAECCGRGQGGCCGGFIEQWTPEDHKILDTLSPIQRKLSQALASTVKESLTHEPAPFVRLTEEEVTVIVRDAAKGSALNRDGGTSQRIANAIMDKMIAKNGGK